MMFGHANWIASTLNDSIIIWFSFYFFFFIRSKMISLAFELIPNILSLSFGHLYWSYLVTSECIYVCMCVYIRIYISYFTFVFHIFAYLLRFYVATSIFILASLWSSRSTGFPEVLPWNDAKNSLSFEGLLFIRVFR